MFILNTCFNIWLSSYFTLPYNIETENKFVFMTNNLEIKLAVKSFPYVMVTTFKFMPVISGTQINLSRQQEHKIIGFVLNKRRWKGAVC